jgi:hypothetical protein
VRSEESRMPVERDRTRDEVLGGHHWRAASGAGPSCRRRPGCARGYTRRESSSSGRHVPGAASGAPDSSPPPRRTHGTGGFVRLSAWST